MKAGTGSVDGGSGGEESGRSLGNGKDGRARPRVGDDAVDSRVKSSPDDPCSKIPILRFVAQSTNINR